MREDLRKAASVAWRAVSGAVLTMVLLQAPAFAQSGGGGGGGQLFGRLVQLVCMIANELRGPLGLAIGVAAVAAGGIAIAVGGRRGMSLVAWALIGTAVAVSAFTIISAAFGNAACGS